MNDPRQSELISAAPVACEPDAADAPSIAFRVNGREQRVSVDPARACPRCCASSLGLTGTKVGCMRATVARARCCWTGDQVCACLVAAGQVAGAATSTTVEGLAVGRQADALCSARSWRTARPSAASARPEC